MSEFQPGTRANRKWNEEHGHSNDERKYRYLEDENCEEKDNIDKE